MTRQPIETNVHPGTAGIRSRRASIGPMRRLAPGPGRSSGGPRSGERTEAAVVAQLRGTDVLLTLDSCEHVIGPVTDLVTRLLDSTPGLTILCTSQLPLGLAGETTYQLEPLTIDDSVHLFTQLAVGHRRSFVADGGLGRDRHAEWFDEAAARAADGVRGPGQAGHLAFVRTERANIDDALAWATVSDPALGLRIASGFGWAWMVIGDRPLGARRLRLALEAATDEVPPTERGEALCLAAWLATDDVASALAAAEEAMTIAEATGDEHLGAISRNAQAFVLLQQARPHEALQLLLPAPAVHHRLGHPWEEGAAWILIAHAGLAIGDTTQAARACQTAEHLIRGLGDDWALGHLDGALGFLAQTEHRFMDAAIHLRAAAEASGRLGFQATQALHLATLGRILQQADDPSGAIDALERAVEIGRVIKDMRIVALARARLARVLRSQGDYPAAKAAVQAADHWFRTSGGGEGAALAAYLAAAIDAEAGDPSASARLQTALQDARHRQDQEIEVLALDALARSCAQTHDSAASELLAQADALMPSVRHLLSDADRIDGQRARSLLTAAKSADA